MYTHDSLTLHAGPGRAFSPVSTLPKGESITVLWCNTSDWCLVQGKLFQGWAPLTALQNRGNGDSSTAPNETSTGDADLSAILPGTLSSGGGSASAGGGGVSVTLGHASVAAKLQ